jgi:hypothetical protein
MDTASHLLDVGTHATRVHTDDAHAGGPEVRPQGFR